MNYEVEENKGKRQKYRVWTRTQRAEIGKPAADLKLKKRREAADSDITETIKKKLVAPRCYPKT